MMKRLLALVLVLALTVSNLPVAALAAELNDLTAEETVVEETTTEEIPEEIEEIPEETEEITEETEVIPEETEEIPEETEEIVEIPQEESAQEEAASDVELYFTSNDPDHPAYLSFSWLYNDGSGWAEDEYSDGGESYNIMPGISYAHIYYVNTWDASLGQYVKTPIFPMWDGDLEIVNMGGSEIAPDQPNQYYFVWVRNHGTWDQVIPIYYILDDGTRVDHIAAYTFREELCLYDSPVMSNESCVIGNYMYDMSTGAENPLYVGFNNDYWTDVSFAVEYGNLMLADTSDPKVKQIYLGGDAEWSLKQGYDQYFAIRVDGMQNGYQQTAYVNFAVSPDPATLPHDPYISYGWLNNMGNGWFLGENPEYTYFQQMPGMEGNYGFVLNTWDAAQQAYVQSPVIPQNDYGLVIEQIQDNYIVPEYQGKAGYVTVRNNGVWDVEVPLYTILEDGTRVEGVTVSTFRTEVAFYHSPNLSNETLITEFVADFNSDDNHFYIGVDSEWITPAGAPYVDFEEYKNYFTFEKVTDAVYEITITREYMERMIQDWDGQDWFGSISWQMTNNNGEMYYYGVPYGLHIVIDSNTMPHDPYITYGWLNNMGDGFFVGENPEYNYFEQMPGVQNYYVFVLNTWDEAKQAYVQTPVIPTNDYGLVIEPIVDEEIKPDQPLAAGFASVSNPGVWDMEVPLYAILEDGTKVGGITVRTSRAEVCLYNSPNLSNETVITEFVADYNSDDNHFYIGLESDWVSPIGEPFVYDEYAGFLTFEKVTDTVYKVTLTRAYLERMANFQGGEDWYGGFSWEVKSLYGDTWFNGIPYGLHIIIDPATMPHDTYLSYGWLNNYGEGYFDPADWRNRDSFNICPGDVYPVIFFLNVWNDDEKCFEEIPVSASDLKCSGLTITTLKDAAAGQENAAYFVNLQAKENYFGQTLDLYVMYQGEKISLPVTNDLHRFAFYSSQDISYKTYLMEPMEIDPFGETAVYAGFYDPSGDLEVTGIGFDEGFENYATIQQVSANVWKITPTQETIQRMAQEYIIGIGIWIEFKDNTNYNWFGREGNWVNFSRMELPVKGYFNVDFETYEILEGGYTHRFPTGEVDEWGNEIWAGEFIGELPKGLSYDYDTNTLTMDNYHGESISFGYRSYNEDTGEEWVNLPSNTLTIELIGDNSLITEEGSAADFWGNLNVKFVGNGSLHLKSTNSPNNVDHEGRPFTFPTLQMNEGSLTFEDSVNVTVEIAGTGMGCWWDEKGETHQQEETLAALMAWDSEIYVKDNATLTTKVPEGGKSTGPVQADGQSYGGYVGINDFRKLHISGGTVNTSDLCLRGYYDWENKLHTSSLMLTGGTLNIDALGNYCMMEDWQWDEETQQDVLLGSYEGLHYFGLEAGIGTSVEISGGHLNIDVDPSEAYEDIRAMFTGLNLMGADMVLSGGVVSIIPGYEGTMVQLTSQDFNEETYYTSNLVMTGGTLNLDGKDDCRVNAIWMDGRSGASLTGGTITADNADFRMDGEVIIDGASIYGNDIQFYAEQFAMESGYIELYGRSVLSIGMGEMNGGKLRLLNSMLTIMGGFAFNDGRIAITNDDEEMMMPAVVVQNYMSMNGSAKLTIDQDAVAPAMEVRGTFHQMDNSLVSIKYYSSVGEAAVFVPDGPEGETHGTLLLNDGKFRISSMDEAPVVGLRTDCNSVIELGEGEMELNNATVEMGGVMTILNADFRMNASLIKKSVDQWYIAFLGGAGSYVWVEGGSLTIDTQGYDCAFDLCGDYYQFDGTVTVNGDNMAMAVKGMSTIEGGELNLKGVTGYTQNYEPELDPDPYLRIFGGTVNIEAVALGMELTGRTKITGGQLNINVSGNEIITDNSGAILMGRGILVYSSGMEANLVISGGDHSITVPTGAVGYLDSGLQAILAADSKVEFLGGTLKTNSLHGIMSDTTREDLQFHLGQGMTAYDLDSGKEMIPVDHIFYADENYQPVSPENAVYIEYIRIFEKDNKPDGDIFTEEGIQWAGNLLICEDNRVIESFEADADQLLPGKKATLTAVAADGVKLTWSLAEGDKDYATLKVGKNNTATVTAKKNKQIRDIKVTVSAVVDGRTESKSVTIEILPVVSQVEIRTPDQTVINGETAIFYMDQQDASQNVFQVIAVCAPAEAVQDVTWKSSDAKSVSVDENGVITALVPGKTVTITATATDGSGKKATFKVKTSYAVESIRLSGSEVCAVGKTISLTAEVLPENATNKKLVWSIIGEDGLPVSKNEIASISNGKLKGLAAGEVTVRATWEEWVDVYAEWTVTILPVVKQVDILNEEDEIITKKTVELRMSTTGDNTMQLYAVNSPEGAAQSVTWKSANTKVATVDENGLVTALVPGKTVKITATATDGSGKNSSVTVKTVQPMENVFISGSSVAAKGKTITLTADIFPANTTNKKLVWSVVEGSEYATVSNGKLKVGKNVPDGETVTVRVQWAEDESIYDEWTVTLYAVAASKVLILDEAGEALTGTQTVIMSTEGENTLCLGYEVQKAEAAQEVAWKSSNVRYATVDENGVVTVLVPGKVATITATAADGSGKKTTIKVKGVQPVEELTLAENLVLDETGNLFIAGGKSLKLAPAVIVNPSNPSNKKLDWKIQENGKLVTKTAAASISTSGVLTAKKVTEPVTVTVVATAKDGYGATIAFDVTIYPATTKVTLWFDAYDLTGKTLEVFAATQIQLEAKSQPENGAQKYTWKSSNEKYVTVDENGLVTLRDGLGKTVTITATAADGSGKKATMKITFSAEENMVPIG